MLNRYLILLSSLPCYLKESNCNFRVQSLESETSRAEQQLRSLDTRMKELKQIVGTMIGFGGVGESGLSGSVHSKSTGALSTSTSGRAGGGSNYGRFSPPKHQYQEYAVPTSPARRGSSIHASNNVPSLVVGGSGGGAAHISSPVTPLRSPPTLNSPDRYSRSTSPQRHVSFPAHEETGGGGDLDNSRLSVDFEQALEQMLVSISNDPDLHVPVQQQSSSVHTDAMRFGSTVGSSSTRLHSNGGGQKDLTVRTASISRVDERLQELKTEKERLRKLLMSRVETL